MMGACMSAASPIESIPSGRRRAPAEWLDAAAIFAVALVLRLLHLQQIHANDPFFTLPSVDPRVYHEWAIAISQGEWLGDEVFFLGPLYPYFLGLVYALVGPSLLIVKAIHCLIGAGSCVLTWVLARHFFDRRVALLAGATTALYGMLIFYEGSLMIANLLTPLLLLLVLAVVRAIESPSLPRWLLAGALVGLCALARQTALLFAPVVVLWLLTVLRGKLALARRLVFAGAFTAGVALLVLPATVRNYLVAGDLVLINASGGNAFITANHRGATGGFHLPPEIPRALADDPREQRSVLRRIAEARSGSELLPSQVSAYWVGQGVEYIRAHPDEFIQLAFKRLGLWLNAFEAWTNRSFTLSRNFSWVLRLPLPSFGSVAPFAFLGIALTLHRWRELFPLHAILGIHFGASFLFIVLSRYRVPVVPLLNVFAAAAGVWIFDALRARRVGALALAAAGLAALIALVHLDLARENLSMAYYNLGNKYKALGHYERAVTQYERSLARDPSYLPTWNNLAMTYEQSGGRDVDALETWKRVLEMGRRYGIAKYVERASRRMAGIEERRQSAELPGADAESASP
jgi:4-amino-4-deoxy-L-arabinose transferase-like glycosyltransferase